ncbi:MAG: redoxin domain-containing protein [Chlorobi bacterium]|nr:redoxin domain-containing protein [Chlorobiota bacterium]
MNRILILLLILTILGCKHQNEVCIKVNLKNAKGHSFEIHILDNEILGIKQAVKANVDSSGKVDINLPVQNQTLSYIRIDRHTIFQTILRPGDHLSFTYDVKNKNSLRFSENNKFNKIVHDISSAYPDFIYKDGRSLSSKTDLINLRSLLDSFAITLNFKIDSFSHILSKREITFLKDFNYSTKHSWLFSLPNQICGEKLKPDINSQYYTFIDEINPKLIVYRFFPYTVIMKYVLQYKRDGKDIHDIVSFWNYMSSQITSKELKNVYLGWYLSICLDAPSVVYQDQYFFDKTILNKLLSDYSLDNHNTKTIEILRDKIDLKKSLAKGTQAKDFVGYDFHDELFKLSDFKGKLVFIEVWSTRNAPCYSTRPQTFELINKYKIRKDIVFLLVSVIRKPTFKQWYNIVKNETLPENAFNLRINPDSITIFIDNYYIKGYPKYILIDKKGKIIHSVGRNLGIDQMEKDIEQILK